jgi:hypothetical protein
MVTYLRDRSSWPIAGSFTVFYFVHCRAVFSMSSALTASPRFSFLRPSRTFLYSVLSLLVLLFFIGSLMQPYVTDDALIYALIGKGVYAKGLLPFSYAFDHKPIFTYYIYGLVELVGSDDFPKYQILSVIGYAASACLTKKIAGREKWWLHFW